MKNKKVRRLLAGMLATTMILGTSMVSLAADTNSGTGTGTGTFEGHVDTKVVSVTLPTEDGEFDYIMDPEGLIAATEKAKYPDTTFEEGASVYFLSGANAYTSTSKKLKVVNKGSVAVDVTVQASVAENAAVIMAGSSDFGDSKKADLYLGLTVADQPTTAVKTTAAGTTVGLAGSPDNFEVVYSDSAYSYAAKDGLTDDDWNSFEFGLEGACNTNGDWSAESLAASAVTVTWAFEERAEDSDAPMVESVAKVETAETAHAEWDKNYQLWFALNNDAGGLTEASKLTDVKLANENGEPKAVTAIVDSGWAYLKYDAVDAAGIEWVDNENIIITFKYDGKAYEATLEMK